MSDYTDDIHADIRAAFEAEPVTEAEPITDPVENASEPEIEQEPTRVRDDKGKFVAKEPEEAQDNTPEPEPAEPPKEAIRPPAGWTPAAKAKFAGLDPDIQREVLKREKDFATGLEGRTAQLKRYEPLEALIAPHRSKWGMAGMDEVAAIRTLLSAQDVLEQNSVQGIQHLMRAYGVSLDQLTGQPSAQSHAPAPAVTQAPEFQALKAELEELKQTLQTGQQATYQSQIEAFQGDPANIYFENVRADMADLLKTGKAKDLPEAYEMACWMRPDIRPLLQTAQTRVAADPKEVARKKAAGASVTGSPAETRAGQANPNGSIDDDIRMALQELNGR